MFPDMGGFSEFPENMEDENSLSHPNIQFFFIKLSSRAWSNEPK
jgi:hypothetical protein